MAGTRGDRSRAWQTA